MYSMPQQAVANGYVNSEYLRAQPRPFETRPCRKPVASSRRVAIAPVISSSSAMVQVSHERAPFFQM
jgi:hypothetical protein